MTDELSRLRPPAKAPPRAGRHCRYYSFIGHPKMFGPRCTLGILLGGEGATAKCEPDPTTACTLRKEWSDAERSRWAEFEELSAKRFNVIIEEVRARTDFARGRRWNTNGSFPCPVCGGRISWEMNVANGVSRRRAECDTPFCFGVIE